jgi:hypothetical protein
LQIAWRKFTETAMPILQSAPLLWGLAGLGVIALAVKKGRHEKRIFLALYALFSLIAICPGFYFRPHYYLLLLPAAALLAGISIETLQDVLGRLHSRIARNAILILVISFCLGLSLYQQRDFFFHMTPLQISRSTYGSNPFHESLEVAKFIQEHTRPNDRIAILGSEPQIYFYSQRHSASSYIYMYPLMEEHEFAIEMQKEMIKQIEASRPTVIVFVNISSSWSSRPTSHKKVFDWFNKYTSNDYKLAGVVELFEEETLYHWRPHLKWPADSPYWILLFERIL